MIFGKTALKGLNVRRAVRRSCEYLRIAILGGSEVGAVTQRFATVRRVFNFSDVFCTEHVSRSVPIQGSLGSLAPPILMDYFPFE